MSPRAAVSAYLLTLLCLLGSIARCGPRLDLREAELKVDAPLDHIVLRESRIIIYPAKRADWTQLVNLAVFEGFRPGMTFETVRQAMGQPDKEGTNLRGLYYEYHRLKGDIVIAYERQKSAGASYETWRLHAFPKDKDVSNILASEILRHIEQELVGRRELVMMRSDHSRPALEATLHGRSVEQLTWIAAPEP